MEIQRRTLDTLDTVDRVLNSYASGGCTPQAVSFSCAGAPLATSVSTASQSTATATQTEAHVSWQKSTQISPTSRSVGTETRTVATRSVSIQTDTDVSVEAIASSLSTLIEGTEERLEDRLQFLSSRVDETASRLEPLITQIEHCTEEASTRKKALEVVRFEKLLQAETAERCRIKMEESDCRLATVSSLYMFLLYSSRTQVHEPEHPYIGVVQPGVQPTARLMASSPESTNPDALTLLLKECIDVLEDG